jgi:uncharacterized protein YeaO (DUF488 family)
MIQTKRIYEDAAPDDGYRVLVDRLWPRGVSKQRAALDEWARELAPSDELRRWFNHQPDRYPEFSKRYREELRAQSGQLELLRERAKRENLTLLYAARDRAHNEAAVLEEVLQQDG